MNALRATTRGCFCASVACLTSSAPSTRLTTDKKLPTSVLPYRDRLVGFNGADWTHGLDAAGYPAESKLPPGYRAEAPEPLVARASGPANQIAPATVR